MLGFRCASSRELERLGPQTSFHGVDTGKTLKNKKSVDAPSCTTSDSSGFLCSAAPAPSTDSPERKAFRVQVLGLRALGVQDSCLESVWCRVEGGFGVFSLGLSSETQHSWIGKMSCLWQGFVEGVHMALSLAIRTELSLEA